MRRVVTLFCEKIFNGWCKKYTFKKQFQFVKLCTLFRKNRTTISADNRKIYDLLQQRKTCRLCWKMYYCKTNFSKRYQFGLRISHATRFLYEDTIWTLLLQRTDTTFWRVQNWHCTGTTCNLIRIKRYFTMFLRSSVNKWFKKLKKLSPIAINILTHIRTLEKLYI